MTRPVHCRYIPIPSWLIWHTIATLHPARLSGALLVLESVCTDWAVVTGMGTAHGVEPCAVPGAVAGVQELRLGAKMPHGAEFGTGAQRMTRRTSSQFQRVLALAGVMLDVTNGNGRVAHSRTRCVFFLSDSGMQCGCCAWAVGCAGPWVQTAANVMSYVVRRSERG
ncbi:hypothetical protein OBBRIDRAFT_295330 [Obba rivulosa]|uniref:Uncharacterized protein n=1 Tax=Obba rivulosa TaxID=1052685 RepID=A0A8E2DG76_9APHY|nr:hypothetical protein OBBRIDRAFT_295330 [Obba rivulosa]